MKGHDETPKKTPTPQPGAYACKAQVSLPDPTVSPARVHESADLSWGCGVLRELLHPLRGTSGGGLSPVQAQRMSLAEVMRSQIRPFGGFALEFGSNGARIKGRARTRGRSDGHRLVGALTICMGKRPANPEAYRPECSGPIPNGAMTAERPPARPGRKLLWPPDLRRSLSALSPEAARRDVPSRTHPPSNDRRPPQKC